MRATLQLLLFGGLRPNLDLNFLNGVIDGRLTVSGGANGTRVNSAGVIVAATCPRFDYDPVTLAPKGVLVEAARTNSFRNNTMAGAVAASPGTAPTNWVVDSSRDGLTRTISLATAANGAETISFRYAGTASAGFNINIVPEANTVVAASNGQAWAFSSYVAYVKNSGTDPTIIRLEVDERDGAGAFLAATQTTITPNATLTRYSNARTNNNASTAFEQGYVQIVISNGVTYDFTITVGLPQLELGDGATSVIRTSSGTVTRTADDVVMTGSNFSSWYGGTTKGVLVVEGSFPYITAGFPALACLRNTGNNAIQTYIGGLGTVLESEMQVGGVQQAASTVVAPPVANTVYRIATSYDTNYFQACANGGTPGALDNVCTVPTPVELVLKGRGNNLATMHVRKVRVYCNRTLAGAGLQKESRL